LPTTFRRRSGSTAQIRPKNKKKTTLATTTAPRSRPVWVPSPIALRAIDLVVRLTRDAHSIWARLFNKIPLPPAPMRPLRSPSRRGSVADFGTERAPSPHTCESRARFWLFGRILHGIGWATFAAVRMTKIGRLGPGLHPTGSHEDGVPPSGTCQSSHRKW